jgi:hypothetical protein
MATRKTFGDLTPEQHRELSRRGGIASGEARRRKRQAIDAAKLDYIARKELAADPATPFAVRAQLTMDSLANMSLTQKTHSWSGLETILQRQQKRAENHLKNPPSGKSGF